MRTLGRLILVPLALLVAAAAAMMTLVSLGQERVTHAMRGADADVAVFGFFEVFLKIGLVLLNAQTLLLPFLVVVAGEVARIRSAAYYVASFGALAALIPLLGKIDPTTPGAVPVWAIFATAGFAGGFVYWLLAGRSA
jgi:hypothetical protein